MPDFDTIIDASAFAVLQERKPRPLAGIRELLDRIAALRGKGVLVRAVPARDPKAQRGELAGIVRGTNVRWRRMGYEAKHGPLAWAIRRQDGESHVLVYAMAGGAEVGVVAGDDHARQQRRRPEHDEQLLDERAEEPVEQHREAEGRAEAAARALREADERAAARRAAPRDGGPRLCPRCGSGLVVFPDAGGPARCNNCGMRPSGRPTAYESSR